MAYIPIIGPSIILIKISPSPDTSGKNIVERFYKLPIFILRMEEMSLFVKDIPVIIRTILKESIIRIFVIVRSILFDYQCII